MWRGEDQGKVERQIMPAFTHGGEFGLGNCKFIGIQAARFGKNRGPGVSEDGGKSGGEAEKL